LLREGTRRSTSNLHLFQGPALCVVVILASFYAGTEAVPLPSEGGAISPQLLSFHMPVSPVSSSGACRARRELAPFATFSCQVLEMLSS